MHNMHALHSGCVQGALISMCSSRPPGGAGGLMALFVAGWGTCQSHRLPCASLSANYPEIVQKTKLERAAHVRGMQMGT